MYDFKLIMFTDIGSNDLILSRRVSCSHPIAIPIFNRERDWKHQQVYADHPQ